MSKEKENSKRTFEVDGIAYAVRRPKIDEVRKANEMRSSSFNEALSRGDLLREQLDSELRKRSLWNDSREEEYQRLRKEILDGEWQLKRGGIRLTNARNVAIDMADSRGRMIELLSSRTELDSNTCEGKADAVRFNCLFAHCLVYDETGESYFPNGLDDYLLAQDDPVAVAGATEFYYLISNSERPDEQLPENQFLKQFEFVDDKYRLVDEDGRLIDKTGRHIDEFGNMVKWVGDDSYVHVDTEGREVKDDGEFNVTFSPFLTDDGDPIIVEDSSEEEQEEAEEAEEKPKKKTTKKKTTATKKKAATKKKKKAPAKPKPEPEAEAEVEPEDTPVEEVEEAEEETVETPETVEASETSED